MTLILKMSFEFKANEKNLEKFIEILDTFNSKEIISGEFEFIEVD